MDFLRILGICLLVAGLNGCRKKSSPVESDIRDAGYEMTTEGWFSAIRSNDVAVMKKMVVGSFDDKTIGPDGKGGLHVAAAAGSKEAGDYLLNRGHSVDAVGPEGRTPLMEAVLADRPEMVKWLLSQGADPKLKDHGGFMALMLAASEGKPASAEELAPYNREDLDSALLLAALVGETNVIDVLTNYGASVYARMEDGRTPLMLAAQNGHAESVALLIDIGASRFATTENGATAQSFAVAAGHNEIAALIESGFSGDSLAFESDEEVAVAMGKYVDEFEATPEEEGLFTDNVGDGRPTVSRSARDGALVGAATEGNRGSEHGSGRKSDRFKNPISDIPTTLAGARIGKSKAAPAGGGDGPDGAQPFLPLVMRHYRQRELPVEVKKVSGGVASLRIAGPEPKDVEVQAGETIQKSKLMVVRVFTRVEKGKLNNSQPIEVGIVEIEDTGSGEKREWIAGMPASGHDPIALVEDATTGQRYIAKPGQKFTSEDGREFIVSDVRPGQIVIEDTGSGEMATLRLRGPRG